MLQLLDGKVGYECGLVGMLIVPLMNGVMLGASKELSYSNNLDSAWTLARPCVSGYQAGSPKHSVQRSSNRNCHGSSSHPHTISSLMVTPNTVGKYQDAQSIAAKAELFSQTKQQLPVCHFEQSRFPTTAFGKALCNIKAFAVHCPIENLNLTQCNTKLDYYSCIQT